MTDKARRMLFLGAVFCGFLALYLFTAQRGVSWQDSGEFQYRVLAGDFTGIFGLALAHPLYIALARLFAAPFSGDAAIFAVTAFSSFTAALALLLLAALVLRLTQNYLAALVSVLTLGFAHMFWTLGCLAEVYTLSLAFLFAELLCLSHILSPDPVSQPQATGHKPLAIPSQPQATSHQPPAIPPAILLFFLLGLHFSVSNDALLALPVYLFILFFFRHQPQATGHQPQATSHKPPATGYQPQATSPAQPARPAQPALLPVFFLLGAAPILYLFTRSALSSGFLPALSSALFGGYRSVALGFLPANSHLAFVNYALAALSFLSPAWLFALFSSPARPAQPARPALPLFSPALLFLLLIHFLFWVRYFVPDQATFILPTLGLLAVLVGLGAARVLAAGHRRLVLAAAALGVLFSVSVPLVLAHALPARLGQQPGRRALPFRNDITYWLVPAKCAEDSAQRFTAAIDDNCRPGDVIVADLTAAAPLLVLRQAGVVPGNPYQVLSPLDPLPDEKAAALIAAAPRAFIVSPQPGYEVYPFLLSGAYTFAPEGPVYRIKELTTSN